MRAQVVVVIVAAAIVVSGCSKESSPATPSPVVTTETFTGTARANGPGNCSGDAHAFSAQPGTIAVTLVQAVPAENMTVQICSVMSATDCSLTRRQINIGQTVETQRNGVANQTLSLLPLTCGTDAPPSSSPIAYTVTVRYSR